MTENWFGIPGWEDRYRINRETQQVWSLIRNAPLTAYVDDRGRVLVTLTRDRKQKRMKIAVLMLLTFVGEPQVGHRARHLNDNPGDNTLENLRWGTQSQNMYDKVANGKHWNANKIECHKGHAFTPENTAYSRGGRKRSCRKCAADRTRERRLAAATI